MHSAGSEPFGSPVTGWCEALELEFHNLRAVFAYLEAEPGRRPVLLDALTVMRLTGHTHAGKGYASSNRRWPARESLTTRTAW